MRGRTVLFEQRTQGITQAGKWSMLGWDFSIISDCTLQEDKGDWELSALCALPALLPAAGLAPTGRLERTSRSSCAHSE